jgi:arylsulfatase A-like enzyme
MFVLTDDQDGLLNGYNQTGVAHMKNLDERVRKNGVMFTNYYLAYPLCSPSRGSILTSLFPHNHHFVTNSDLNTSKFHPTTEKSTVAVWLQDAGYHTMLCGKYMNGYHANSPAKAASYVPPGWTDWYGFQTVAFFGTAVLENGVSKTYPKEDYQTDIIANLSLSWLKTKYNRSKPFFMFITPHAPHAPYTPAPRHKVSRYTRIVSKHTNGTRSKQILTALLSLSALGSKPQGNVERPSATAGSRIQLRRVASEPPSWELGQVALSERRRHEQDLPVAG